jgi:hypothetical protein
MQPKQRTPRRREPAKLNADQRRLRTSQPINRCQIAGNLLSQDLEENLVHTWAVNQTGPIKSNTSSVRPGLPAWRGRTADLDGGEGPMGDSWAPREELAIPA